MSDDLIEFVRGVYRTNDFIPLHAPTFSGKEKEYVIDTINSTFVSSVGKFVDKFENKIRTFTGAGKAVATVNGTAALHTALYMSGVKAGDLVITQALTFVATCNVLHHMGVDPVFVDVSKDSLGMSPKAASIWLEDNAVLSDSGDCIHKSSGRTIKAIMPMHTFGHPVDLDELIKLCDCWNLVLIEDSAESLGSLYKGKHTGTIGDFGALSFNGNKIITTGGGGMVLVRDTRTGKRTKHITTTAKVPHPYEFYHDEAGFNYRMPNLNAALGCAQMDNLSFFIAQKRVLASKYMEFFRGSDFQFVSEPDYAVSNYWLNAIICQDESARDLLLEETNRKGVMTRPVWTLMTKLPMYSDTLRGSLECSEWLEKRLVNLPSTPVGCYDNG